MNLFNQYETQSLEKEVTYSIDNKRNYGFVNPVTIRSGKYKNDAVNIKFLQPTSSESKVKKAISFTFHLDELEKLIGDLSDLRDKLKINTEKVTVYPTSEVENVFYAIMENYFEYSVGDGKVPKPRLSVYREGDKVFFGVVDFKNNTILMNHEIYLENMGINLSINEENSNMDMEVIRSFENIAEAIATEITNCVCNSKEGVNFSYIKDKLGDLGEFNIPKIIRSYVYENIRVEEDVFITK